MVVTCRMCGTKVHGYWEGIQTPSGPKSQLMHEDGTPHHLYENGIGRGCVNSARTSDSEAAKQHVALTPRQVSGLDKATLDKIDGAVTAANTAFSMAINMTELGSKLGTQVGEIQSAVESLDSKWTRIAEANRRVEFIFSERTYVPPAKMHKKFERLVHRIHKRQPVWIKGPAGGGKTMGVAAAAEACGLPFYPFSIGPLTSKSDLYGFISQVNGVYQTSVLRKAVETGGVWLGDEIDRGNAGLNTMLNIPVERNNRLVPFPDATIEKHEDYCPICTANTFGLGADAVYVGANQQDGAFLDRFAVIEWEYDWDFCRSLANDDAWVEYVASLFTAASNKRLPVIIGPRAAIEGAEDIRDGMSWAETANERIWGRVSSDMRRQLELEVRMESFGG